jgi:hypothetical protein
VRFLYAEKLKGDNESKEYKRTRFWLGNLLKPRTKKGIKGRKNKDYTRNV